jgi:hypothetical protein
LEAPLERFGQCAEDTKRAPAQRSAGTLQGCNGLFDTPEEKSLRTLRYEFDLASTATGVVTS